jgi:hypothetical protein
MPFYKKASEETIQFRKEEFANTFGKEIEWLSTNPIALKEKFLKDMLNVLQTGNRPFSEKMHAAVVKSMNSPKYDEIALIVRKEKLKPIYEKVNMVWELVAELDESKDDYYLKNHSALPFVDSIKIQLDKNGFLSEKQLNALNKIYKRYKKQWDSKQK